MYEKTRLRLEEISHQCSSVVSCISDILGREVDREIGPADDFSRPFVDPLKVLGDSGTNIPIDDEPESDLRELAQTVSQMQTQLSVLTQAILSGNTDGVSSDLKSGNQASSISRDSDTHTDSKVAPPAPVDPSSLDVFNYDLTNPPGRPPTVDPEYWAYTFNYQVFLSLNKGIDIVGNRSLEGVPSWRVKARQAQIQAVCSALDGTSSGAIGDTFHDIKDRRRDAVRKEQGIRSKNTSATAQSAGQQPGSSGPGLSESEKAVESPKETVEKSAKRSADGKEKAKCLRTAFEVFEKLSSHSGLEDSVALYAARLLRDWMNVRFGKKYNDGFHYNMDYFRTWVTAIIFATGKAYDNDNLLSFLKSFVNWLNDVAKNGSPYALPRDVFMIAAQPKRHDITTTGIQMFDELKHYGLYKLISEDDRYMIKDSEVDSLIQEYGPDHVGRETYNLTR